MATNFSFHPDFEILAKAYGIAGYTFRTEEDLIKGLPEALQKPGPAIINCIVPPQENVLPMVLAGKGISEAIDCKMKTLLLNPPSFEKFDGGAGARWPARREIASYWYPVWLAYPAGLIKESRLLDAPPHGVGSEETIRIARDFEFLVLIHQQARFLQRRPAGREDKGSQSRPSRSPLSVRPFRSSPNRR